MKRKLLVFQFLILLSVCAFCDDFGELEPKSKAELSVSETTSTIILESNIPSAEVYINNVYQGKTKLTIRKLLPGNYRLEIRKNGYKTQKYSISTKKGYSFTYRVNLEPEELLEEETL